MSLVTHTTSNVSGLHKTQLLSDSLHALVASLVVICTTVLAAMNRIPADVTGAVYTGVIGYVAGRAGNVVSGRAPLWPSMTERDETP